jgi:hypothetical protein
MLVDALARATAAGFLLDQPDDLARFGLAEPAGRIRIEGERILEQNGEVAREPFETELRIGARMGAASQDRFGLVPGRPTVIRVPQAAIEALFRPATALVSATGSGVQPADVKLVRIATNEHDFTLERELEEWAIVDRPEANVVPQTVERLLDTLSSVQAGQVLLQEYPVDLEVAVVTLVGYDRLPMDTVRIVRDPSTGNWAFENGDNVLRIMSADLDLPLAPDAFTTQRSPR